MITDAVLNAVFAVASAVLDALPTAGIQWTNVNLSSWGLANAFFPLSEIMAWMRALLVVTSVALLVWVGKKVVDWLPFT